jgi:hypothetical protein
VLGSVINGADLVDTRDTLYASRLPVNEQLKGIVGARPDTLDHHQKPRHTAHSGFALNPKYRTDYGEFWMIKIVNQALLRFAPVLLLLSLSVQPLPRYFSALFNLMLRMPDMVDWRSTIDSLF